MKRYNEIVRREKLKPMIRMAKLEILYENLKKELIEKEQNKIKKYTPEQEKLVDFNKIEQKCFNLIEKYKCIVNQTKINLVKVFSFDNGEDLETSIIRTILDCGLFNFILNENILN
jgi:hypothetical protein